MPRDYEELDYQETPLGALTLRRRRLRSLDNLEVYEIILGTGYLMSSLFTTVEIALADLALARLPADRTDLSVVVGGLGLGYTARAALTDDRVGDLLVVEALPEVIGWHRRGMVPLGRELHSNPICHLIEGDFFVLAATQGFDPGQPGRRFDAVEAKTLHLVTQVAEQPEQAARALADAILTRSPDAVSATKALFHSTRHAAEDQAFDRESSLQFKLLRGRNQGEAMAANLKKREPRFRPRQRDY